MLRITNRVVLNEVSISARYCWHCTQRDAIVAGFEANAIAKPRDSTFAHNRKHLLMSIRCGRCRNIKTLRIYRLSSLHATQKPTSLRSSPSWASKAQQTRRVRESSLVVRMMTCVNISTISLNNNDTAPWSVDFSQYQTFTLQSSDLRDSQHRKLMAS